VLEEHGHWVADTDVKEIEGRIVGPRDPGGGAPFAPG
jgi:hypothetical protein